MSRRLAVALCLWVVAPVAAAGAQEVVPTPEPWTPDVAAAREWASRREGVVAFAAVDEAGRLTGHALGHRAPMASLFKVMLLVAYLNMPSVRGRDLRQEDRNLLAPMIRWSDNATASRIRDLVGSAAIRRVARRGGMADFDLREPWGLSLSSPRDQAPFLFGLDQHVPARHRVYARKLLRSIVARQRWGIPEVTPEGWTVHFKGGWGSGTGRVVHQVAFLEAGDRRIALAIFTEFSPSHAYGTRTVRGVAARLLRGLEPA